MIQLAEGVGYLESRKVPLNPRHKKVFVEVASDQPIDVAVVNAAQLREFEASDNGDDVEIAWTEYTRGTEFEYELADPGKQFLLFWNANEEDDAVIAYKITPLD